MTKWVSKQKKVENQPNKPDQLINKDIGIKSKKTC